MREPFRNKTCDRDRTVTKALCMATIVALYVGSMPAYADYVFQVINYPGALYSEAFGINNAGEVTGQADDGVAPFSYLYNMKSGDYSVISYDMGVLDISNTGVLVGDANGACAIGDKDGDITIFSPPSVTPASFCQARGTNSNGVVSGFEVDEFGVWLGFVYDPKKGTYVEFLPSTQTIAHAVNASGQVAGSIALDANEAYFGSPAGRYGFVREADGATTYFEITQAATGQTRARGISDSSLIAGWYVDPEAGEYVSFSTELSKETGFESITLTEDEMIYRKPCDPNLPSPPGPGYGLFTDVTASQIRNDGVVVGSCVDVYYNDTTGDAVWYSHGFTATPIQ